MTNRLGLAYFQEGLCTAYVARKGRRWDPVKGRIGTAMLMHIEAVDGTGSADHQWFDLWEFRGLQINSGDTIRFPARRTSYSKNKSDRVYGHIRVDYKLVITGKPEKILPTQPLKPLEELA